MFIWKFMKRYIYNLLKLLSPLILLLFVLWLFFLIGQKAFMYCVIFMCAVFVAWILYKITESEMREEKYLK
jgi:hypothetical protein